MVLKLFLMIRIGRRCRRTGRLLYLRLRRMILRLSESFLRIVKVVRIIVLML